MLDPLWTFRLPKVRHVRARVPVPTADTLYQLFVYDKARFHESVVIAFDAGTGAERWRRIIRHVANQPVSGPDGMVYVSSFAGSVHAFDAEGNERWCAPEAGRNLGVPCLVGERLAVAETGGSSRRTWGLEPDTGAVVWTFDNGGHSYRIAAADGVLVHATARAGTEFGESTIHLIALAAGDGRLRWSIASDNYLFAPDIVEQTVVIGARGALRAYALADGDFLAGYALPERKAADRGMLRVGARFTFADDKAGVHCVELQRRRSLFRSSTELTGIWSSTLPREATGAPVDLGRAVALLTADGVIHALGAEDGALGFTHRLGGGEDIGGGLARSGAMLFAAHGREVSAFRIVDGS